MTLAVAVVGAFCVAAATTMTRSSAGSTTAPGAPPTPSTASAKRCADRMHVRRLGAISHLPG